MGLRPWTRHVPNSEASVTLVAVPGAERVPPLILRLMTRGRRARAAALLVAGTDDVASLADLTVGRLRTRQTKLAWSLTGRIGAHQRFMLTQHLVAIDGVNAQIAAVSAETETCLAPVAADLTASAPFPASGCGPPRSSSPRSTLT